MTINNLEFGASLDEILAELRTQLSLNKIELLQKQPKESGNNIQIQCPYHGDGKEHRPSAGIRKDTGVFHCFACNETHDLPEVISYCFGKNDLGAFGWNWLLKNFLTIQVEERRNVQWDFSRDNVKIPNCDRSVSADIQDEEYVSEHELDGYRYYHPYWAKRGIVDEEIIELFDLGFDVVRGCITFPVRDINGNCLFVARRSVKTKFFSYPEGVKKPLYGLYELSQHWVEYEIEEHIEDGTIGVNKHNQEVIVCESMIDCILLWQAGYYAVALNGLGNDLQFKQLQDLPCRKLILATDNDEAGSKARQRIKKYVKYKLFTEIDFPKGVKDIGECTEDELKHILDWEVF